MCKRLISLALACALAVSSPFAIATDAPADVAPVPVDASTGIPPAAVAAEKPAVPEAKTETVPSVPALAFEVVTDGKLAFDAAAGQKVFLQFKNSAQLSALFAKTLTAAGSVIVPERTDADVVLDLEAIYIALRGNRRIKKDVGELVEKAGTMESRGSAVSIAIQPGSAAMSASQATGVASLLTFAANVTGFHDWFNTLVTGNPDGYCLLGCDFQQIVMVQVSVSGTGQAATSVRYSVKFKDEKLHAGPMVEKALSITLAAMAPSHVEDL